MKRILFALLLFINISAYAQIGWPVSHAYAVTETKLSPTGNACMTLDVAGVYKFWDLESCKLIFKTKDETIASEKLVELGIETKPKRDISWNTREESKDGKRGYSLDLTDNGQKYTWWVPSTEGDTRWDVGASVTTQGYTSVADCGFMEALNVDKAGTWWHSYYLLHKGKEPELLATYKNKGKNINPMRNPRISPDGKLLVSFMHGGVYDIEQRKLLRSSQAISKNYMNLDKRYLFTNNNKNLLIASKFSPSFFIFDLENENTEAKVLDPNTGIVDNTWQHELFLANGGGSNHVYSYINDASFSLDKNRQTADNLEILEKDVRLHVWRLRVGDKPVLLVDPDAEEEFKTASADRKNFWYYMRNVEKRAEAFYKEYTAGATERFAAFSKVPVNTGAKPSDDKSVLVDFSSPGAYEIICFGKGISGGKIWDAERKSWADNFPFTVTVMGDDEGENHMSNFINIKRPISLRFYVMGKSPEYAYLMVVKKPK